LKIVFTLHALERIKTRCINRSEIVLCITNPDKVDRLDGITRAIKKRDGEVLLVFYRLENSDMVVITAYRSSKRHKYLK